MMRPRAEGASDQGLLEYLEDIIGTNRFVEPLSQASKR